MNLVCVNLVSENLACEIIYRRRGPLSMNRQVRQDARLEECRRGYFGSFFDSHGESASTKRHGFFAHRPA